MPGSGATNPLVAYGLLGLILAIFTWLLLTKQLIIGQVHTDIVNDKDLTITALRADKTAAETRAVASEASKAALEESFRKEVIPTMTRFLDLAGELSSQAQATRRRS